MKFSYFTKVSNFIRKNFKAFIFISLSLMIILYISYWSGNNFEIHLNYSPNFRITNINQFWLAFSSLSTLTGIIFALFRNDIYHYLFRTTFKIELDNKKGIIHPQYRLVKISHLIKVINIGKVKLENIDFYYQSIRINNNEDILHIRRPMAWSRKEEGRNNVELFDYDHLDFVYGVFDLQSNEFYYYFESRGELINIPDHIYYFSEVLVSANYLNQKSTNIYKINININEDILHKIRILINEIKANLINELTDIDHKLRNKEAIDFTLYNRVHFAYSKSLSEVFSGINCIDLVDSPSMDTLVSKYRICDYILNLMKLKYNKEEIEDCVLIDYFSELFEIDIKKFSA